MWTGKWQQRAPALILVVLWHALVVWLLTRGKQFEAVRGVDDAIQVIYLPAPLSLAANLPRTVAGRPRLQRMRRHPAAVEPEPLPVSSTVSTPVTDRPVARHFLDQALQSVDANIRFANRTASGLPAHVMPRLPGSGAERFRMRDSGVAKGAVAFVGRLFAPAGYDANPCPRNDENIGNLMAGQDPTALQQELDFRRRNCRP